MNKEYKCAMCGSVSKDVPGTCCGAERKEATANVCLACQTGKGEHTHPGIEKKSENKCESCGHEHKEDGKCDCGCKM